MEARHDEDLRPVAEHVRLELRSERRKPDNTRSLQPDRSRQLHHPELPSVGRHTAAREVESSRLSGEHRRWCQLVGTQHHEARMAYLAKQGKRRWRYIRQ